MKSWLLYGAYGYTGALIAEEAVRRGHRPLLAGRSAEKLAPLATRLGLDYRVIDLGDQSALDKAVAEVDLVLHAAGPFVHTAAPMLHACLKGKTHYLDITGEIPVFESLFTRDAEARQAGVLLISGVGFDVVPTDCMARYVADKLPDAESLELAFSGVSTASAGTVKSMLEMAPRGNLVRRSGKLIAQPFGVGAKPIRFSRGEYSAIPIPWGDLSTGYRSTGIPNITTYMAAPVPSGPIRLLAPLGSLILQSRAVRRMLARIAERRFKGPDEALRQRGRSYVWACAAARDGGRAEAWLETAEAYWFTALASLRAVERVLAEGFRQVGALTPSLAFGADFVLDVEGSRRFDSLPS